MKFLGLVWSNLKRKKLRTALTLLSIFVAFLLFGCLSAIQEAFAAGVRLADASRIVTRHRVSIIQSLPSAYQQRIAGIPGVASVAHQSWFGGLYQNDPKNFLATIAVNPEEHLTMYPELILPEDQKKAWMEKRNAVIIGRKLSEDKRFLWKIGDRIPLTSPIWGQPKGESQWDFEVAGIYDGAKKSTDTSALYLRYDFFDEAREQEKGKVGWYVVRIEDPRNAPAVAKAIDEEFANSPNETKSESEAAFAASFISQLGNIGLIVTAILGAVFFTILFVAGNTMSQAIRERTSEIGVLKAAGFTNRLVLALVLAESLLIALLGGVAGILAAWLISLGGSPAPQFFPIFIFPVRDMILGVGFAVALGFAAGAIPAWQAMRLHIAEALRRTG